MEFSVCFNKTYHYHYYFEQTVHIESINSKDKIIWLVCNTPLRVFLCSCRSEFVTVLFPSLWRTLSRILQRIICWLWIPFRGKGIWESLSFCCIFWRILLMDIKFWIDFLLSSLFIFYILLHCLLCRLFSDKKAAVVFILVPL